jgi:hypothetical protein
MKDEVGQTLLSVGLDKEARNAVLASTERPTDRNVCPTLSFILHLLWRVRAYS